MSLRVAFLITLAFCISNWVYSANESWELKYSTLIKHKISGGKNEITNDDAFLVRLDEDEIIFGSVVNESKNVLVLAIFHRRHWNNDTVVGTWYSRLVEIRLGPGKIVIAHDALKAEDNFLEHHNVWLNKLISVAENGKSIVCALKRGIGRDATYEVRTIQLSPARFLDE